VYTVAYGSENTGCNTDTSGSMAGLSPCTTMEYMSSGWPANVSHFFSDTSAQVSGGGNCPSTYSVTGLNNIFKAIQTQLSKGRLIPNGAA
jgi:hypothetical protein